MIPTSRRLIIYVGKTTLEDIADSSLRDVVKQFCEKQEKENPEVKKAEIRGTRLHQSHDDPNDKEPVISIQFKDENDKKLGTGHVHEDGSGKTNWNKW